MADYNLGTAHGKIVVDYNDKGVKDAEKSFDRVRAAAERINRALDSAGKAAVNVGKKFVDMNGGLGNTWQNIDKARNSLVQFHNIANRAAQNANKLKQAYRGLYNSTKLIATIGQTFLGWGPNWDKMGEGTKAILQLRAAIETLKGGMAILTALNSRFALLAGGRSAIAGLVAAISRFVLLNPLVMGMGRAFGVVGLQVGKAGGILRKGLLAAVPASAILFSKVNALRNGFSNMVQSVSESIPAMGKTVNLFKKTFNVVDKTTSLFSRFALMAFNTAVAFDGLDRAIRLAATSALKAGVGITALTVGIKGIGTVTLGAVDIIKQLSGLLVALPGIVAVGAAVVGTLKLAFQGLDDAFKALLGPQEDFDKAMEKLSPNAKKAMTTLRGMKDEIKEVQKVVQDNFMEGFSEEIERIGGPLIKRFQTGLAGVATSLNRAAKEVTAFLGSARTGQDITTLFDQSSRTVDNLRRAIQPLLEAFRDIAIVGAQAMGDLSRGAGGAAERFANFIAQARQTGKLRQWIDEGVQGIRDLYQIISNIGTTWREVMGIFGVTGDNALSKLSELTDRMAHFFSVGETGHVWVQKFADSMRSISAKYIEVLSHAMEDLVPAVAKILPWVESLTDGITNGLNRAIDILSVGLNVLAGILSGPIGGFLSSMASDAILWAIALKALKSVSGAFAPLAAGLGAVFSATKLTSTGISTFIDRTNKMEGRLDAAGNRMGWFGNAFAQVGDKIGAVSKAHDVYARSSEAFNRQLGITSIQMQEMGRFSAFNARAAEGLGRSFGAVSAGASLLKSGLSGAVGLLGGPLAIAIEVAGAALIGFMAHMDRINDRSRAYGDAASHATEATHSLVDAFEKASGAVNADVINVLVETLRTLRSDLDATAKTSTSWFEDLKEFALTGSFMADSLSRTNAEINRHADEAKNAEAALKQLGWSEEEVTGAIRGSSADWGNLTTELGKIGTWGQDAINVLKPLRDRFLGIQESMARMGPGAVALEESFSTLRDTASTTADRLDAIKTALTQLGILQVDAAEAGFAVTKAIEDLGVAAQESLGNVDQLGRALLNEAGNGFNYANTAALALFDRLQPLGEALMGVASAAESPQEVIAAWDQMQIKLNELRAQAGLAGPEFDQMWQSLLSSVGLVPDFLQIAVSLKGNTEAEADLKRIAVALQTLNQSTTGGVALNVKVNSEEVIAQLRGLGAQVDILNADTGEVRITSNSPEVKAGIEQVLGAMGIVTSTPAQANVEQGPGVQQTGEALGAIAAQNTAINNNPVKVEADASEAETAQGEIENMATSVVNAAEKMAEFATAIATAMAQAVTVSANMAADVITVIAGMAPKAVESGAALGSGFANGILSRRQAVYDAALALAEAAAAPLPRSPAKVGPFSGKGWTLYRGRALASGFAQGIYSGSPEAQSATLDMAKAISDVIDNMLVGLGMASTKFNANIDNKAGTRYYRDPNITDAQLAQTRQERAEAAEQQAKDDAFREKKRSDLEFKNAMDRERFERENATATEQNTSANIKNTKNVEELAKQFNLVVTSNKRNEPGSFHHTGEAFDVSGSPADMAAFNKYVAEHDPHARELFYDPGINIDEGKRMGAIGGHSDHVHYVPSEREYNVAQETQEHIATNTAGLDEEQQAVARAFIEEGRRQGRTDEEIISLLQSGIVESGLRNLPHGPDSSIGSLQQQDFWGTFEERMDPTIAARKYFAEMDRLGIGGKSAGEMAADVQRPREDLRGKYAQQDAKARAIFEDIQGTSASTAKSADDFVETQEKTGEELVAELSSQDQELAAAVATLNNQSASDEEIIRALQTIDDKQLTVEDPDVREQLEAIKSATMEDRGIKQYDPFEGASTDLFADGLRLAQSMVGFFHTIEEGINSAAETAKLLIRGVSNTKELNTLVDGFQSMASTVSQIISTIGEVVGIVASIAAAAGSAIPGVGAVTGTISAITGGIGNVNAIIDLVQDVLHIGGRFAGGILSALAGGANGPLYGNVRTLLDMNDRTIKTWSDRNPAEKSVFGLPGSTPRNPNQAAAVNNLNIYQGPGEDPAAMMNRAMFVVKSHSTGVFAG